MKPFRSFVPPLAAMLMAASGGAPGQEVLIDSGEIRFIAKQMGVNVEGRFRKWKANMDFRPGDLARSKAAIEIDLASVDFAGEEAEAELRRPLWFDTAKHPVATFVSTGMKELGGDRYEIAGTLSMKGTARDVVVPVVLRKDAAGNRVAEGAFAVKRLEFKVGEGLWSDTSAVANEVSVRVRLVLPPVK